MQTLSFIGSEKNAGKTTALCYEYGLLLDSDRHAPLCISSIGINGELLDSYDSGPKPAIDIHAGTYFITSSEHLRIYTGFYRTLATFPPPLFKKHFILGQATSDIRLTIEGPNEKTELLAIKQELKLLLNEALLLLDGSIDRQFIAHPEISDSFCFSLLISEEKEQMRKVENLLFTLSLPVISTAMRNMILNISNSNTKSLLLTDSGQPLYKGTGIPFLDNDLISACYEFMDNNCLLYLNGALSNSLFRALASLPRLGIILNNFTLCQSVDSGEHNRTVKPDFYLFHPVAVKTIYLNQKSMGLPFSLPARIPTFNIFREAPVET